jgi:predicted NodU family carbamoyl transferase
MKEGSILGISGIDHAFAVSLLTKGAVAFAIEEDKLRRFRGLGMRHLTALGSRAIDLAVSKRPGGIRNISTVAYVPSSGISTSQIEEECAFVSEFLRRHYDSSPAVMPVDHIAAHLAFERAVHATPDHVLYASRSRAVYSSSVSAASDFNKEFAAVRFVECCAQFLGLSQSRIQHLENITRLGNPRFLEPLKNLLHDGFDPTCIHPLLEKMTGSTHVCAGDSFKDVHFDLAASLHTLLREEVCDLLRSVPEESRAGTVALSGGVFQSWRLNDALAQEFPATRFVVSFAPGNASCAIGGPLVLTSEAKQTGLSPFLGPNYSPNDVKAVLDNCKARYELHSFRQSIEIVSDALSKGDMVGWFSGPCEFGYRALGARSVFANPANPYACDNLSSFLKRRPSYFTYAIAMRDCDAPGIDSPHLSRSIRLPEYFADSPVRIQTVSTSTNPVLHQLLEVFQARTGVRALLNTSLNYFDEPIACTPRDALKTFYASGLDVLVMENFVLRKT